MGSFYISYNIVYIVFCTTCESVAKEMDESKLITKKSYGMVYFTMTFPVIHG